MDSAYKETRRRLQRWNKETLTDKDIIELLAAEIEQYRNKIRKLTEAIEKREEHSIANNIEIEIKLEAEETINKLEKIKKLIIDIKENANEAGIDFGQDKDYTTTTYYDMLGNLIKEETVQYK